MKKKIAITLTAILAVLAILYFVPILFPPLNRLLILSIEKRFNADIECKKVVITLFKSVETESLKIIGRDGLAISIDKGLFRYRPIGLAAAGKLPVRCVLEGVSVRGNATIVDLATDLMRVERLNKVAFSRIEGDLFVGTRDTMISNLIGKSDIFGFRVDGVTSKDNTINLRITLLLEKELAATIPEEVRGLLFKEEDAGRLSAVMAITGNYKKPAFRLLMGKYTLDIRGGG